MKRLPRKPAGAALAACVSVLALAAGPAAAAGGARVSIRDSGFKPAVVRVKQWQVVTWANDGKSKHGVASDTGSTLASGALDPGQAYGNLFTKAGTFAYHDPVHPSLTGRVVVIAAPKPKVTGQKPPSGKRPKGFQPKPGLTSAPTGAVSGGGGADWTAIGAGLGAGAVVVAAGVFLMLRRRGPVG